MIVDDLDAPTGIWVHWVLYDLPARSHELGEAIPNQEKLGNGAKQGVNDFGKIGYVGPCPPRGLAHRYFFKLYALDRMTELKPRATKQQLVDAMNKHNIFWRKRSWSASTSMGFSSNAANQIVLACTVEKRQRLVYSDRDPTEPCSVAASIGFVERILK